MRKKIVFSAALLAATCALNAQTTADNGYTAIPSPQNDQAIMFVLSPNGRYVGGYTYVDHQFYIYDAQQKTAKTFGDASADNLVDLRSISNDGKAVGMLSTGELTDGVVCNFADGTSKTVKSTITKGLTPDGNFITGAKLDGSGTYWNAVYFPARAYHEVGGMALHRPRRPERDLRQLGRLRVGGHFRHRRICH